MDSGTNTANWYVSSVLSMADDVEFDSEEQDDSIHDDAADVFLNKLSKRHDSALFDRRLRLTGFYQRFHDRWQDAFETLDFTILVHEQAGVLYKSVHDLKYPSDEEKSYEYSALVRLHARACQVAREVLTLIKAGYADGAVARWRALFDMATVAVFIADHGDKTAERFLKYRGVETLREGKEYQEYHEDLGFAPLEDSVMDSLRERVEGLTNEYGNSFKSNWGWAEQDLREDASRRVVAREAGTVEFTPFYAFASNAVHGGSKGTQYRLGLTDETQDELLPLGPTDIGFTDPAQLTSLMLHRVTAALLQLGEEPYWAVMTKALDDIAHEVPEMFTPPVESSIEEASSELTEVIMERVKEQITEREEIENLEDIEIEDIDIGEILEDVFNLDSNQ
jgi:hypothetical protein